MFASNTLASCKSQRRKGPQYVVYIDKMKPTFGLMWKVTNREQHSTRHTADDTTGVHHKVETPRTWRALSVAAIVHKFAAGRGASFRILYKSICCQGLSPRVRGSPGRYGLTIAANLLDAGLSALMLSHLIEVWRKSEHKSWTSIHATLAEHLGNR